MSLRLTRVGYFSVGLLTASLLVFGCQPRAIPFQMLPFGVNCPNEENPDCNWDIAYQYECDFVVDSTDSTGSAGNALVMTSRNGVGYLVQDIPVDHVAGLQIATLTVDISTSELTGKGAGLTITVLGVDSLSMQYAQISDGELLSGTGSETQSIQIVVPENAATIRSGLIAYGHGAATFSNVRLEVVTSTATAPSPLAREYIDAVIDTVAHHSLMRDSVDIEALREKGYQIAGSAEAPEDVWLAVRYLLGELKDHHSFFMTNPERKVWAGEDDTGEEPTIKYSSGGKVDDFGYLNVPGFHANVGHLKESFADSLRSIIDQLRTEDISGWIVDLRGNDGGNMHPMLAGLEPLFSADTLGSLVDVKGQHEYWGRSQTFKLADEDYVSVTRPSAPRNDLPIAVLYGGRTGSSGEIVILSFVGNARTKSFGQPSFGLTTGNGNFYLPDSSYLFLASTYMVDRTGKVYGGKVTPDTVTPNEQEGTDETLAAAVAWLKSQ